MSFSKPKFRTLLLVIAVLLLLSTFMSFAQSTVKLRVVTYFTGEDPFSPAWKEAMALFKQKYPNVEIIDEAVPTANDAIRTKVKTDFATDNEPDVMFFFTGADAVPLLKTGKVYAWDEEIENTIREHMADFQKTLNELRRMIEEEKEIDPQHFS